jgi:hypothetical protein
LKQNYEKPTSETRKLVNQSRFEMTSDECTSRERSKREQNRTENKTRKGMEQQFRTQENRSEQTRKDNKYRGVNVKCEKRRNETTLEE